MQSILTDLKTPLVNVQTIQNTCLKVTGKITSLRASVLETIRNHMPITTLFTPELKIDLGHFIKDQMFIRRIAEFLAPLIEAPDSIDSFF